MHMKIIQLCWKLPEDCRTMRALRINVRNDFDTSARCFIVENICVSFCPFSSKSCPSLFKAFLPKTLNCVNASLFT